MEPLQRARVRACVRVRPGVCVAVRARAAPSSRIGHASKDLPEGLDGLWDLAYRAYMRIRGMVDRGETSWGSLPAAS